MYVKFEWPRCSFLNATWDEREVDSFVVEATPFESENLIIPHLTVNKEGYKENRRQWEDKEYFLIARDLSSVISIGWDYPISPHWGDGNPFRYKEVLIKTLADLSEV